MPNKNLNQFPCNFLQFYANYMERNAKTKFLPRTMLLCNKSVNSLNDFFSIAFIHVYDDQIDIKIPRNDRNYISISDKAFVTLLKLSHPKYIHLHWGRDNVELLDDIVTFCGAVNTLKLLWPKPGTAGQVLEKTYKGLKYLECNRNSLGEFDCSQLNLYYFESYELETENEDSEDEDDNEEAPEEKNEEVVPEGENNEIGVPVRDNDEAEAQEKYNDNDNVVKGKVPLDVLMNVNARSMNVRRLPVSRVCQLQTKNKYVKELEFYDADYSIDIVDCVDEIHQLFPSLKLLKLHGFTVEFDELSSFVENLRSPALSDTLQECNSQLSVKTWRTSYKNEQTKLVENFVANLENKRLLPSAKSSDYKIILEIGSFIEVNLDLYNIDEIKFDMFDDINIESFLKDDIMQDLINNPVELGPEDYAGMYY